MLDICHAGKLANPKESLKLGQQTCAVNVIVFPLLDWVELTTSSRVVADARNILPVAIIGTAQEVSIDR